MLEMKLEVWADLCHSPVYRSRVNVLSYDNQFFPQQMQIKAHFIWVH